MECLQGEQARFNLPCLASQEGWERPVWLRFAAGVVETRAACSSGRVRHIVCVCVCVSDAEMLMLM